MKVKYNQKPKVIGTFEIECSEMMYYQYLPIKLKGDYKVVIEPRISCFNSLIDESIIDYISEFGPDKFLNVNLYITAKSIYQKKGKSINRNGYHSDGFMTDDINYLWSDVQPTVFNGGNFYLSQNDTISMLEINKQAKAENEYCFPNNTLLRLNQFVIHKVSENVVEGVRTFVKISFSPDKYDLKGNSHNYNLNYKWDMRKRNTERNIPQII